MTGLVAAGAGAEKPERLMPRREMLVWRATFPLGPLGIGLAVRLREPIGLALSIARRRGPAGV
jgi:hypothetical protein